MKCARRTLGSLTATAALTAAAVFGLASPAAADVGITPSEAIQGGGLKMILRVTNDSATATVTTVEMQLPGDSQIQDVFPVAVGDDDFTPLVNMRWLVPPKDVEPSQPAEPPAAEGVDPPVDDPEEGLDSDEPVAEDPDAAGEKVPSGILWTALPGREIKPGASTDLRVSMGPMPRTDRMVLGVVVTHSDGTVVRYTARPGPGERQAPVLTLRPPRPGEEAAANAHGATRGEREGSDNGTTMWWLLGGLAVVWVLATVLILRRRRATPEPAKPTNDTPKRKPARPATKSARPTKATKSAARTAKKSANTARPAKQPAKKALAGTGQIAKSDNSKTTE